MSNSDKLKEAIEKKRVFMESVDTEVDALRTICLAIESMDDAAKLRIFNYLKSKYAKTFPTDYQ